MYGSCFISFFSFSCLVEIFVVINRCCHLSFFYFLLVALFSRSFGPCFLPLLPFLLSAFSSFLVAKYVACFLVMLLGVYLFLLVFLNLFLLGFSVPLVV